MTFKPRTGLPGIIGFAAAIVGFGLLMWTPRSGKGILLFAGLVVLLVAMAMFLHASRDVDEAAH